MAYSTIRRSTRLWLTWCPLRASSAVIRGTRRSRRTRRGYGSVGLARVTTVTFRQLQREGLLWAQPAGQPPRLGSTSKTHSTRTDLEKGTLMMIRIAALFLTVNVALVGSGCSSSDGKRYDISPIFPLSADKCKKYNGDETGEGFNSTCMVEKSDCERAAEDWRQAMSRGSGSDAIQFSCD